ncbi:MAG: hypothetical protein JWM56_763 [Candidatus Peribacteria bacterium]|nr:hypothetical protein [Candidatus Peribacteria bacterium]
MGLDVRVIARIHDFQPRAEIEEAFRREGISLTLVPHTKNPWPLLSQCFSRILRHPSLLDGAALEYADPAYEQVVLDMVQAFKPQVAWLEYTSLWPIMQVLQRKGIPCIMKSSLIEPLQSMDDNGRTLISRLKAIPKFGGEYIAARESTVLMALTPDEKAWYDKAGAKRTELLPLRGLAECFERRIHTDKQVCDVVFLSSNYNMGHNRDAALFLLKDVIPAVRNRMPGTFRFYLTGSKFPASFGQYLADDVVSTGFIPDLAAFLSGMDIAVCPWVTGHGMQQKVFEPLCRSIPLITNRLSGYPFKNGEEVCIAASADNYVEALAFLSVTANRQNMADAAYKKAKVYFDEAVLKKTVLSAVDSVRLQNT